MQSEHLLTARRFEVHRVTHELQSGATLQREVVRHPGSVVIIPRLNDGRLCLIRNYRVAVDQTLIELPAGTLEAGEPPRECAFRELTEETGYRANRMDALTAFYAAPGILDEYMHLFLATELEAGEPAREPGEEIENLLVEPQEALQLIRQGEIKDAKTIIGLMFIAQGWTTSS